MSSETNTKPLGVSFAEWKKQQNPEKKEATTVKSNPPRKNYNSADNRRRNCMDQKPPSLLDIKINLQPDFYVSPHANDFFMPMQQPLQMQTIANPFASNRPFMPQYFNGNNQMNQRFNYNNREMNNRNRNDTYQAQNNNSLYNNGYKQINNRFNNNYRQKSSNNADAQHKPAKDINPKQQEKEQHVSSEQQKQNETKTKPSAAKAKAKKPFIPRPPMPQPEQLTNLPKEERKKQWKEYRQAIKPFKHKEYANAKRAIQRLGKRDRSTLEQWELFRLQNAEEYIAQHKLKMALKNIGLNEPTAYVKKDVPPTLNGKPVGEVYVLAPAKPRGDTINALNKNFVSGGLLPSTYS